MKRIGTEPETDYWNAETERHTVTGRRPGRVIDDWERNYLGGRQGKVKQSLTLKPRIIFLC
jgi:hypothetical protein